MHVFGANRDDVHRRLRLGLAMQMAGHAYDVPQKHQTVLTGSVYLESGCQVEGGSQVSVKSLRVPSRRTCRQYDFVTASTGRQNPNGGC